MKNPTAYCVVCKKKVKMVNPEVVEMKNGRLALEGYCPHHDDMKVFRFISQEDAEGFR